MALLLNCLKQNDIRIKSSIFDASRNSQIPFFAPCGK